MRATEEREESIRDAEETYEQAACLASLHGLTLKRYSPHHYQLTNGAWVQNIYPANQRLYYDRNHPSPGFLYLPRPWRLIDVIKAAIRKVSK